VLCPSCGAEHDPAQGAFCAACGLWVGRAGPATAAPRAAAPAPGTAAAADDDEGRPCPECGVRVVDSLTCRQCGARLRPTDQDDEAAAEMRRRRILRQRERAAAAAAAAAPSPPDAEAAAAAFAAAAPDAGDAELDAAQLEAAAAAFAADAGPAVAVPAADSVEDDVVEVIFAPVPRDDS